MSDQRLSHMEAKQAEILVTLEVLVEKIDVLREEAKDHRGKIQSLLHDHSSSSPGLVLRVDRLEQMALKASAAIRKVAVAVLGACAAAVGAWLSKR